MLNNNKIKKITNLSNNINLNKLWLNDNIIERI